MRLPTLIRDFKFISRITMLLLAMSGFSYLLLTAIQYQKQAQDQVEEASSKINKLLSYDIDYVKYQILYSSNRIESFSADQEKTKNLLSGFASNLNNQSDIALTWNAFSWIDENNYLTIDGNIGILPKPIDLSSRDYLAETSSTSAKIIFGNPIYGALSGRYLVPAGIGVFRNNGKYLGTLVFGFDIEKIIAKLEKTVSNKSINFAIFKNKNLILSSENFDIKTYVFQENKALDFFDLFSDEAPKSIENLKNYPFTIVANYDNKTYFQNLKTIFFKQLFFISFIIFLFFLLFSKINYKIIDPINKIAKFSRKLLQKDFHYETDEPRQKDLNDIYQSLIYLREMLKSKEKK